jgi:CheY-like chemotaxis protein
MMKKKRILCVEAHEDTCSLFSTVLKKYEIKSVKSKSEALIHATKEKFDLYLLNYHLPDGDGLELSLLIKNFDPETPILFVTGTNYITERQALMVGAKGLLKIDGDSFLADLEKKVSELLENQGAGKQINPSMQCF